jgi:thiol:disulfide interchange protein DsbA
MFHPGWDVLAKAFYVAETLNKSETWDPLVFQALHVQRRNLTQEHQLIDFFKEQGLAEAEFKHIYHSFSMDQQIKRAQALAAGYRISVSPVVVVHTPHAIFQTNAVMIQSEEGLPEVIEQLIQMR